METAGLKLWEVLGQEPRNPYLAPHAAEVVLTDVMSKHHGWILTPEPGCPRLHSGSRPCWFCSKSKGAQTPPLLRTKFQPDPGQGPCPSASQSGESRTQRSLPVSTWGKLASWASESRNVLMSPVLQGAQGWRDRELPVDHHLISASRESCTEFRIIELQAKSWSIVIVGVAFIIFLQIFCVQFSSLTIN